MLLDFAWDRFVQRFPEGPKEKPPRTPYMSRMDLDALTRLCNAFKPKRVLEIGTAWGDTTLWLAKHTTASIVTVGVSIEMGVKSIHPGEIKPQAEIGRAWHGVNDENGVGYSERITPLLRNSITLSVSDEDLQPLPFDMILIDGAHDYEHVKHDTDFALKAVNKNNGLIIWHDVTHEKGVNQAVNELPQAVTRIERTLFGLMAF